MSVVSHLCPSLFCSSLSVLFLWDCKETFHWGIRFGVFEPNWAAVGLSANPKMLQSLIVTCFCWPEGRIAFIGFKKDVACYRLPLILEPSPNWQKERTCSLVLAKFQSQGCHLVQQTYNCRKTGAVISSQLVKAFHICFQSFMFQWNLWVEWNCVVWGKMCSVGKKQLNKWDKTFSKVVYMNQGTVCGTYNVRIGFKVLYIKSYE